MAPMKIMLVANHPDDALALERALVDEGHSVATCHDDQGAPCRGVAQPDSCPLESSVDLTVIARASGQPRGLDEIGAVCSARHRIGVVEIDPGAPSDLALYELADAAEELICRDYERSVTDTIREIQPDLSMQVAVRRHDRDVRVRVVLRTAAGPLEITAIADRARSGVRRHDRFAQIIDVAVLQQP
ncbi:MAG: hypothetical protein RI958_292 [Actinomycetota bacterium]|jgi:hypothetical protein